MASFDEDERLARQLQEEENELERQREESRRQQQQQQHQAMNNLQNPLQQQQSIRTPHPSAAVSRVTAGQIVAIRLQHPASGNQIDEPMFAHCGERGLMMFELVRNRDTYMRTKSNGRIEFSTICDDKARYFVESAPNGTIYLTAKGHMSKPNVAGSLGWNMALNPDGSLGGNSDRNPRAQWRLVAAGDVPPYTPSHTQQLKGSPLFIIAEGGSGSVTSGGATPPQHTSSPVTAAKPRAATGPASPASATGAAQSDSSNSDLSQERVSVEQQMKWFSTRVGQLFLQREPRLMQMFQDGTLSQVLHRPDWHQIALRWKDYRTLPIPYTPTNAAGFTKVENLIPPSLLSAALRVVNFWMGQHPLPKPSLVGTVDLTGAILSDPTLLELLYDSPLIDILQTLLGIGNLSPVTECAISLRFPQLTGHTQDSSSSSSSAKRQELGGRRWFVDNSDPRTPTDSRYSVLVAIPLSAMDSPFSGNLCVIPEGHERVYDLLLAKQRDRDRAGGNSSSSGSGSVGYNLSDELDMNKPDLGEPLQVVAAPGDVILLPGELSPHRDSPNLSPHIRYMVYFRIAIETPAVYVDSVTEGLWSLFNPAIAPRERRHKGVLSPATGELNFL